MMKVYAFIHPELGILCCALLPEAVPPNVEAVELEVETPDDVILDDNGQIRLKTEAEKLAEEKERKLTELKSYVASLLERTDYIIIKIAEAQTLGDTEAAEQLKQKYATQLQQREAIRQWNEQMKQVIRNAKTLEELRNIEIRYGKEVAIVELNIGLELDIIK
jgi:transcriptional regulator of heat shock response